MHTDTVADLPDTGAAEFTSVTETVVPLSRIGLGETVVVREVRTGVSQVEGGDIGLRMLELGFVAGEPVRVVAHGFPGREPIAVRIGSTTFALRRFEADHVLVTRAPGAGAKP